MASEIAAFTTSSKSCYVSVPGSGVARRVSSKYDPELIGGGQVTCQQGRVYIYYILDQ